MDEVKILRQRQCAFPRILRVEILLRQTSYPARPQKWSEKLEVGDILFTYDNVREIGHKGHQLIELAALIKNRLIIVPH